MVTLVETPEDMQELMRECIRVAHRYVDICNETWGLHLPYYKVVFSIKSGTAGRAQLGKGVLQFNPTLLRENPVAFLARTPGHEVVHFANHALHGSEVSAHGPEWKAMMRKLGLPDSRCHSYDTSHVPTKVFRRPSGSRIYQSESGIVRTINVGKVLEFD